MNGLWNIINLIIAIVASIIVGINTANFNTNDSLQSLQIKIIAANILLDLIYVTIGLILEIRGKKIPTYACVVTENPFNYKAPFYFVLTAC